MAYVPDIKKKINNTILVRRYIDTRNQNHIFKVR